MGPFSPFQHLQQNLWAPERPSQHPKCSPCPGDTALAPGATVWTGDTSPKPLSPKLSPAQRCSAGPLLPPGGAFLSHFCVPPGVPKTLLVPFGHRCFSSGSGGPGRSSQAFPPEGAQMSPNPPGDVRPSSWRRGAGTWVAPWGLSPFCGALPPEKKPCQLPQHHGRGENPRASPSLCLEHPQISSLAFGVLPTQTTGEEGAAPL